MLLGSFFGFPAFVEHFGDVGASGKVNISAAWQSGLSNGGKYMETRCYLESLLIFGCLLSFLWRALRTLHRRNGF